MLVLLSLCSSAHREEEEGEREEVREGGRKGSWWETNKLSIQLLVASNTHGALNHHRSDHQSDILLQFQFELLINQQSHFTEGGLMPISCLCEKCQATAKRFLAWLSAIPKSVVNYLKTVFEQ